MSDETDDSESSSESESESRRKRSRRCYSCGSKSHFLEDCPQRKKKDKQKKRQKVGLTVCGSNFDVFVLEGKQDAYAQRPYGSHDDGTCIHGKCLRTTVLVGTCLFWNLF